MSAENPLGVRDSYLMEEYRTSLKRLVTAFFVVLVVIAAGTLGSKALKPEHSLLDCLYFTVITITTIGFREVIGVDSNVMKVFVLVLAVFGMGSMLWFVTNLTAFLFEGHLFSIRKRKRIMKKLETLRGHAIVCGAGKTGYHVVKELEKTGHPYVVVDSDMDALERISSHFPEAVTLYGDATEEQTLITAGIERAGGLISALRDDRDNVFIVLTARTLNPNLMIIARGNEDVATKIRRAGADFVVSPNYIGGLRIASQYLRPMAVNFLDSMLRDPHFTWRIEDLRIGSGSMLAGKTIRESELGSRFKVLVLAIRRKGKEEFLFNPSPDEVLNEGDTLVVLAELSRLNELRSY